MARIRSPIFIGIALTVAGVAGGAIAAGPGVFGRSSPGLWELSGIDGDRSPRKQCLAKLDAFAQLQHHGRSCGAKVLKETADSVTYSYQCGAGDFGSSHIKAVTPKNFRIETQGIAGGLPFSYVVQARWLGNCEKPKPVASH